MCAGHESVRWTQGMPCKAKLFWKSHADNVGAALVTLAAV